MRFRTYKNSDLTVSEVGFGLWTISTGWWGNFTEGEATVARSNKKIASRKLGSSFQKAHATSEKISRRLISAACASVGALESGLTVEPCPTIKRALSLLGFTGKRPTLNVQR